AWRLRYQCGSSFAPLFDAITTSARPAGLWPITTLCGLPVLRPFVVRMSGSRPAIGPLVARPPLARMSSLSLRLNSFLSGGISGLCCAINLSLVPQYERDPVGLPRIARLRRAALPPVEKGLASLRRRSEAQGCVMAGRSPAIPAMLV